MKTVSMTFKDCYAIFFKFYLWFFILFVYLWLVENIISGDDIYWVRMINYFMPWMILVTFFHSCLAFLLRRYIQTTAIFIVFLLIFIQYINLFFPKNNREKKQHQIIISVMSYSVMGRNNNIDAIAKVISNYPADIIFLQELSQPDLLYKKLTGLYGKNNSVYFIKNCLPIVSRFPLKEENCSGDLGYATIYTQNSRIHLWNIHATKSIFGKKIYTLQQKAVQKLLKQTRSVRNEPILIAGDFNATESSQVYRDVAMYFKNTHQEIGFGFGFTFPSPARNMGKIMPFIRIDHIFYNDYFDAIDSKVIQVTGGSDHFPIVALLKFNK